jgi:hypothetical protein
MTVDFQQIHRQIKEIGTHALVREKQLGEVRQIAHQLLHDAAREPDALREKVDRVVRQFDKSLRCAVPTQDPINANLPAPPISNNGTIIAADGSQINPDRHAEVNFCLINVGAISMQLDGTDAPDPFVRSELLYDEQLFTNRGILTDNMLALMRDLNERQVLLDLSSHATAPVITFTDGPLELWGAFDPESSSLYQKNLAEYLQVLSQLRDLDVTTAGYIDKPGANLVTRLLEVAITPEEELNELRNLHPLRGVTDLYLFSALLAPGHRSAVFALQSQSAARYKETLGLHFFYLNVGREGRPDLARVEIPAWVAEDRAKLDALHATLVKQCQILGNRAYPYILHRAHEAALVSRDEQGHLVQMILAELRRRGVEPGRQSPKQTTKELAGRKRFTL